MATSPHPNPLPRAGEGDCPRCAAVAIDAGDRHRRRRAPFRAAHFLRLARLPEGARRQRADPHAAARRGLRAFAHSRGRRCGDRQHLRLSRQREGGIARRDRPGDERERTGDRHRLHGGQARGDPRRVSQCVGHHRPAGVRKRDGGGARSGAGAARPVRRSHPRRGRAADAAPLRLSQDRRRLRQPLHLLHHPVLAREPCLARGRRRFARGRAAGESRRQGAHRHRPGHQRLRPRPQIRRERMARAGDAGAVSRHHPRIGNARRLGQAAICLPLSACRRGDRAHERRQCAALYRRAVPARFAESPEGDAPPGEPGKDPRAHPRLARDLPGAGHPLDLHRRLSRRDRGGFQVPARLARRGETRPRRGFPIRAGQGRRRQRSRP